MWKNTYKDYKPNDKFLQTKVEAGKGIVGCEMNESNGWGQHSPSSRKKKLSLLRRLLEALLTQEE